MLKVAPYKYLAGRYVIVKNGEYQLDSKGKEHRLHSSKASFKTKESAEKTMNKLLAKGYTDLKIYELSTKLFLGLPCE